MVGDNGEVQFRGDLSAEQVFNGGAAVAVIGVLMVIGAVPAFVLRIDLCGNIERIFHAFIGHIGGVGIRNGFVIHAVRSGKGDVFPFGHGEGNGVGIFIIQCVGEISGAAQSLHFRGNTFDMNFEGNLEAVFVNGFQNDFRPGFQREVFLRIGGKGNFFAGYGSITGGFDFEYVVIVAAVGGAVIEIALGQSEGIIPVFIGDIPEERLHIGDDFIGFHAVGAVGFFGFRVGTVLFGDDISAGNGVAFGVQNLTADGSAVIFGETVVAGDVAIHQGSGFRFAGNENFTDEIIGFAGFEILQFVQVFVTGGAFVGVGIVHGEGHGIIGIVSGYEVAEVFIHAFSGANADAGHLGIGIEAVRTEHTGRSRGDGEAAVHGFIGHIIRRGVFHFAGQIDVVGTVRQRVGDGDIQRLLQFAVLFFIVLTVFVRVGDPIAGIGGNDNFIFGLFRDFHFHIFTKILAVAGISPGGSPKVVEEFHIVDELRAEGTVGVYKGNIEDTAVGHAPIVFGVNRHTESDLVIVNGKVVCAESRAFKNIGGAGFHIAFGVDAGGSRQAENERHRENEKQSETDGFFSGDAL